MALVIRFMAYDILIKSGTIFGGSGKAPIYGDVGIKDGIISAIGTNLGKNGKTIIEAQGKYVAPGFIDSTNHSDTHLTLFKYPYQESLLMQGVTTIIGGNCGASLAPLATSDAIGAIRKWANPQDINLNWSSVQEFLDEMQKQKPTLNFGTFIGFGTLRRGIVGDNNQLLSLEEKEKIKFLLREGVEQGALGLSLGLIYGHERVSSTEEIIEIAKALGGTGGIIKFHLRSEGTEIVASVNEAIRIGREAGVPVQIGHLKAIGRKAWPAFEKALELITHARASGAAINYDVSPYSTTGSALYLLVPPGARYGGFAELFRRLDKPEERRKIIEILAAHTLHYDRIMVTSANVKSIVGHTLAEIAKQAGLPPEEALLETIRANEGRVGIIGRTVFFKNTALAIKDSAAFIATDGEGYAQEADREGNLIHPRSFGTFAHFWHRYVQDHKVLLPEQAIWKMTGGPAEKLSLKKRGILAKGNYADFVIFDPKLFRDRATYRNPFRYPAGMEWVGVNGKIAVAHGRHMGIRSGMIVRNHKS